MLQELAESHSKIDSGVARLGTLTFKDLVHTTNLAFTDISTEEYRTYEFMKEDSKSSRIPKVQITIEKPIALNVSKNGHRILDDMGISHYIPQGWVHLFWKVEKGLGVPHFVK